MFKRTIFLLTLTIVASAISHEERSATHCSQSVDSFLSLSVNHDDLKEIRHKFNTEFLTEPEREHLPNFIPVSLKESSTRKQVFHKVASSLHDLLSKIQIDIEHCEEFVRKSPHTPNIPENLKSFYRHAKMFDTEYSKYKLYSIPVDSLRAQETFFLTL